jgi:hypothetical protein
MRMNSLTRNTTLEYVTHSGHYNAGQVAVSATRVKSHDYLVLLVSGVLSRALHLGLPLSASQPFLRAVDALCTAWTSLLLPEHTEKVRYL